MTREEIIQGLQFTIDMFLLNPITGEIRAEHTLNDMDKTTVDACREAIKALEQEPTNKNFTKADIDAIVKAINAHWELIIDEIRAELHATAEMHDDGEYYLMDKWVDEILDKYKAESEDQDGQTNA